MPDGRKRITRALSGVALAALGGSLLISSPSSADPSVGSVQAHIQKLYRRAEVASERVNQAQDALDHDRAQLQALRADTARARRQVQALHSQVVAAVLSQAQGGALSSATQLSLSGNPDDFLQRMVTMSQYADQQTQLQSHFAVQAGQLRMRQQAVSREMAGIAKTRRDLVRQKATIEAQASQAQHLLQQLKAAAAARAAQRVAQASRSLNRTAAPAPATAPASSPTTSSGTSAAPASGSARAAVAYAMAQVGKAYVWGGTGPSGFDCSGLTMMAWQHAGISLPHSAAAQMSSGTPVSLSQLQPGDLVFYYSPVSHVGMYIGNGKIVNAENPSVGVAVAPVHLMPVTGAVRPH